MKVGFMLVKCDYCEKEFNRVPSKIKDKNYCSYKCRGKGKSLNIFLICEICGKEFIRQPNEVRKAKNNYCSNECHSKSKRKFNEFIIEGDITKIVINSPKYGIKYALIDTKNLDKVKDYRWYLGFDGKNQTFYVQSERERKTIILHNLIMNCPKGLMVDHIDHEGLNNLENNLRVCTCQQNQMNRMGAQKNSSSGIRGVGHRIKNKGKNHYWVATIYSKDKCIFHKSFPYTDEGLKKAKIAVDFARKEYFGEFAGC